MSEEYKKPYLILFNGISRALEEVEQMNFGTVRAILEAAQRDAEEAYLEAEEDTAE